MLAHGAGSRLDHPLHQAVAGAIAATGHTVVSFNFVYAELGRRGPDPMPRLRSCLTDVLRWTRERLPARPIVTGGRSMGGRVASLLAADGEPCDGLVLLNYPLLPAARRPDSRPRTEHWPQLRVPVLFVHGNRDRLLDEAVFADSLPLLATDATVAVIEQADHSFRVPATARRAPQDVYAEVGRAVASWLSSRTAAAP